MFCLNCADDHAMKIIRTESNLEKETWRCQKCMSTEIFNLYPIEKKEKKTAKQNEID
jgi:hypothetical protein